MHKKNIKITRRKFLLRAASFGTAAASGTIAKPFISRAADRPPITHGIQCGDISADGGMVWARTDRPARMIVEAATSDSFKEIHGALAIDALPESDFTAKALIEDLPSGQDIFYRIRFEDLSHPTLFGESQVGRFRTAPNDRRSVSFVWSGNTAGQGWGIDEAFRPKLDDPNDPTVKGNDPGTFIANDKYRNRPSAMLRLGNLPKYLNASVHSGEDVILTASGPGSERVRGSMDNTDVFRVMAEALGLGAGD